MLFLLDVPGSAHARSTLSGKVAVVTGASSGIGRVIAESLGMAGAHVFMSGRSMPPMEASKDAIEAAGGGASIHAFDIRDEFAVKRFDRPALCLDRLSINGAGQVLYQLKTPFRDGTNHVLFSPADFIARLAALVPRPRVNLTHYHGVFAPSSPMRRAIVPTPASARRRRKLKESATAPPTRPCSSTESRGDSNDPPTVPLTWAQRLKRVFAIDITLCPLCGGQLRVIADVTDPDLIRKTPDRVNSRAPVGHVGYGATALDDFPNYTTSDRP